MEREEETATRRGRVRAIKTDGFAEHRGSDREPLRVSRGSSEQSNTSIIYGDRLILKLFRRMQPGINPDFEIGRQLTEKVRFTRVPAAAGGFEYVIPGEESSTLAMMQQLVESQADGWAHALDEIGRFFEQVEGEHAPDAPGTQTYTDLIDAVPPKAIADAMSGYLGTAETLGRRTAEMHLALAADSSHPAFAPEPFQKTDLELVTAGAIAQAQTALELLTSSITQLPADVDELAQRLLQSRDTLLERIRSAHGLEFVASKIRVHGDFHLGQVLWAEGDFYLIDFEGEPARPVAERRLKQSPLKDVAGMIRSFGYVAYAGLFAHISSRRAEMDRVEPWARIWQTWTTAAFLRGYFTAAAGALFVPGAPSQRDALLQLFVLDKALYELNYELNNRPDWLRIPLRGIFELLRA
jgi:maltose alpha-D-glucosyltransferase/alpha-amylase